ncbi:hypothetical protein H5410_049298 [Solanum commersonii]|uniref:Uncharacterized protein n=1 Tax=Solanum commersonii TaxID=4109 RepID=A0A9J5XP48_SOLCO|nr:hypothetical protein H5410_049298 [Solanum commersonii]
MWTSQTRNPPILPPFSAILEDGTDPDVVAKSLHKFVNYGKRNKDYCRLRSYGPKDYVQVEDFTNRSQNAARAVGKAEVIRIYKCIQRTSEHISAFMDGLVEIPTLKYQLFGRAAPF